MDFKAIEEGAGTISLQTIDDLFREWQEEESDECPCENVTKILRCLRAALALNARGEVRDHFARAHGETFVRLAWGIRVHSQTADESKLVRGRCFLQVINSGFFRQI